MNGLGEALDAILRGDPEIMRDPYPTYRQLRERAPVHVHDSSLVVVSTHELVKSIYRDSRFITWRGDDRFDTAGLGAGDRRLCQEVISFERLQMVAMNGEDHRRVRRCVHRAFTPRRIARLGAAAQRAADELLDQMYEAETPDLIQLAYRLPLLVIMEMLGAPGRDAELLKRWGDRIGEIKRGGGRVTPQQLRSAHASVDEFRAYVGEMVDRHRSSSDRPGLVAALLEAQGDDRLTQEELVANVLLLLFAGHETTTNLLGNGIHALLGNRAQWDLLCADRSLLPTAVEELLRYDAANQMMTRRAAVDVNIGDAEVEAGTDVIMLNAAANRDPSVFPEPDRLDIARRPNDHLTFGHGVHFCLGAPLARLEATIVFGTIAQRFPDLELAIDPGELEWTAHPTLHGLVRMPVSLGRDRQAERAA